MSTGAGSATSEVTRAYQSSTGTRKVSSDFDAIFESEESKSRYEAFSRLQASAVAFGEKLPIPEIVAIGGQSDGKSSLLEALLGFRFNVREVEMGTRRPLMLQMVHDPSALEPRCRLQDEDSDEYGPLIDPPSAVAEMVRARTEAHLRQLGGGAAVSAKPIVMRAEYAYCANLTIIDSPGFVLNSKKGEPDSTPEEIMSMVKALAAPPHRLILFLQQSSVEWVSSLWLDVVREVDPTFRRTVIVASKFDNRLKEFAEKWEVDRYLSANGVLGENARPFFVALPKDRGILSNSEFRRQIAAVDADILRQLREGIVGGFDEERFGDQIGFGNLRKFLEVELQRRYRDAAPATLALLERRCYEVADELSVAHSRLATAGDVGGLRKAAMIHSSSVASHVVALLDGSADPDPADWGRTSDEEREESGVGRWPGVVAEVKPANAGLRLYGGAAFERVLDEFRCAACSLECPPVSREKVANILLAHGGKQGGPAAAAANIARAAARMWLGPLLDATCDRLGHILRSLFDISLQRLKSEAEGVSSMNGASGELKAAATATLTSYVAFHAALRRAHDRFVRQLTVQCKDRARHHLVAATSPFSLTEGWESTTGNHVMMANQQLSQFGDPFHNSHPFDNDFCEVVPLHGRGDVSIHSDGSTPPPSARGPHPHLPSEDGREGAFPAGRPGRPGQAVSPPEEGQVEHGRESQLTVPETPSPDQGVNDNKRREFATVSGRASALGMNSGPGVGGVNLGAVSKEGADLGGMLKRFNAKGVEGQLAGGPPPAPALNATNGNDAGALSKKRPPAGHPVANGAYRWTNGKTAKMGMMVGGGMGGGYIGGKSAYTEVCAMVVEHFGKIREVVVHRMVPSTLSAGFITPCRERLAMEVAIELFACPDEDFMDLFVAPGVVESLQLKEGLLQKRSETLEKCMQEFRMLARSL